MMNVSIYGNKIFIVEQTFFPKNIDSFLSSNGIVVSRATYPAAYYFNSGIKLYVRGSDSTRNNWPIILKNTEEVIKCVEALREYCEYYDNDFKVVFGRIKMK